MDASRDVIRIPLSDAGEFALIDAADYERVAIVEFRNGLRWTGRICDMAWHAARKKHTTYASCTLGGALDLRLHRVVLDAKLGQLIDHRDHNGLNCCRSNLRLTTSQGNSANCRSSRDSSSQYKGVFRHRQSGKFEAAIRINGIKKHLGLFAVESDAAIAYNLAAAEAFGEFAFLNQVLAEATA